MKAKDIPHNMEIDYDSELNEVPKDMQGMREGVAWLKTKLSELPDDASTETQEARANLLSLYGAYGRAVNKTNESEDSLRQAITIYEELGKKAYVMALNLRLAATLTYSKQYGAATKLFEDNLAALKAKNSPQVSSQIDYGLFHYGKLLMDQKMYQKALDVFLECMDLRISRGDILSIQSVEQAIGKVRQFLD